MRNLKPFIILFFIALIASCKEDYFYSECEYKVFGGVEILVTDTVRFENRCPACTEVKIYQNGQLFRVLNQYDLTETIYQYRVQVFPTQTIRFEYKPEYLNSEGAQGFYYTCYQ